MAAHQSSIPSVVDGLNPVQRHIIFYAFKNPNFQEVKEFLDYISEHSGYYGRRNLATTMTGLAQNYVGSNNINLLDPLGALNNKYIYTQPSSITPHLFHESDEPLLKHLYEDQKSTKRPWFMPIIPMVLVNGIAGGIGANYKPRDIIANLRRLLNHEKPVPMDPWFQWFKGKIERRTTTSYTTSGAFEERKDVPNKLFITELPIGKLPEDYEKFLKAAAQDNEPFIKEHIAHRHDDGTVTFEVVMSPEQMNKAQDEGFENKFNLTTNLDTSNMCLLDANGEIKKYDTPEEILEEFYRLRLEYYEKRKSALLRVARKALRQLEDHFMREKESFLLNDEFREGTRIIQLDKEDEVLYAELENYLQPMKDSMFGFGNHERAEWIAKMQEFDMLKDTSAEDLWLHDLGVLEEKLNEQDKDEAERRMKWIRASDSDIEEEEPETEEEEPYETEEEEPSEGSDFETGEVEPYETDEEEPSEESDFETE